MNKWLFKSDPEHYSYSDLERDGKAVWDGISNNLALQNLRKVRRGDSVFIYHSGKERSVIGLAEVANEPYPDPKLKDPKLVVVDLKPKGRVAKPVTLDEIKKQKALRDFILVRFSRLSVMPVSEDQWQVILKMSGK